MGQEKSEDTIKCPKCEVKLPKKDLRAQVAHMNENHPEEVARRLREAGLSS